MTTCRNLDSDSHPADIGFLYHGDTRPRPMGDSVWRYVVVPVGQGDAQVIVSPEKKVAVVDAGPPGQSESLVRLLKFWDVDRIETIVMTHPDNDHIGGVLRLLEEFEVNDVWGPGHNHPTATYEGILTKIKRSDVKYHVVDRGDHRSLLPGLSVQILNPTGKTASSNRSSIILFFQMSGVDFLLTGDAPQSIEKELVEQDLVNTVDVLKVGHHGSFTSTAKSFVREVRPLASLILSPGARENQFGHPHKITLERLSSVGSCIFMTGDRGYIEVTVDSKVTNSFALRHFFQLR